MSKSDETQAEAELRHGIRVQASFWIVVEGVHPRPTLSRGNLSTTGIFFEAERSVGEVGSIQWLSIESPDRHTRVELLARVIRSVLVIDVDGSERVGTALAFLPETVETRTSLDDLVRYIFLLGLESGVAVDHQVEAVSKQHTARVEEFGISRLVLESEWTPGIGDSLDLEIRSAGLTVALQGSVRQVTDRPDGNHLITVEMQRGDGAAPEHASGDKVEDTFADMVLASAGSERAGLGAHLTGDLSRVKIPTLFSLLEMERMSGVLNIKRESTKVTIWVSEGRVVDAESPELDTPPREILGKVMHWGEGQFELSSRQVEKEDRIGATTTALLIDLAREQDEAAERASQP